MDRHAQITQITSFAISLQYLEKEVSNEVDFLYEHKHESFLPFIFISSCISTAPNSSSIFFSHSASLLYWTVLSYNPFQNFCFFCHSCYFSDSFSPSVAYVDTLCNSSRPYSPPVLHTDRFGCFKSRFFPYCLIQALNIVSFVVLAPP